MELTLKGKTALVSGASGGLGPHVTRMLLDAGATVAGLAPQIRQSDFDHPAFIPLAAQISSPESAKVAVDTAVAKLGKLDILAHLVGGFAGGERVDEMENATWQRMFDLNLNSAFQLLRAVIPHMRRAQSGRIIAIGSRAAVDPGPTLAAYNASKAALVSLIRTVALENRGAGITANVILPGTMDTPANRKSDPQADFSKWVQPATVASLIVWLAGDQAKDVTGAVVPVYGASL
jgi:NAD(P)-dependent dehydrogenase (short-subunit alcohol dehydrogenase family)